MKKMNVDQQTAAAEYEKLTRDVQRIVLVPHHPNLTGIKSAFVDDIYKGEFYVVMPFMELCSLRSIMTYKYNNGLSEGCIAVALKQTLMGLSHLHLNGQLHRDINAGHIFLSDYHGIKLAFAATVYEHDYGSHRLRHSSIAASVSTSLAAAPEVFYSDGEYTKKADIWLIGITALELAYGGIPVSSRRGLEKMINKITNKKKLPPKKEGGLPSFFKPLVKPCCAAADLSLEFLECFRKMVAKCLATEPAQRPTAFELPEDDFFKNCSDVVEHFLSKATPLPPHYY
ncbi:serine/threonine-protein kinase BLUS1-like [Cornus florida]|uniref:serine/threonine-protein kinase BLUS1-like n=1 Tax=Cornus florida TaxID=4283 RepID=UPI00289DCBBA|nr:serine/threonine-protein kinase BLUS1-like [Cornus florida]